MFKAHIKLEVLKQLSQKQLSGYDLMKHFEETGPKKPSPGYIYPLLIDLQKKGFVSVKKDNRRKIYSITLKGRKFLAKLENKHEDMLKRMIEVWEPIAGKKEMAEFKKFKLTHGNNTIFIRDRALMERFRKILFSFYEKKNIKKRPAMKKILEETIKKLEKIK